MRYSINGYLFCQRQTGAMRYAKEILIELDKIVEDDFIELIVPVYANNVPPLKSINIKYIGNRKGNLWEQIDFPRYLKKSKTISLNFNNTFPYFKRGILYIYDIAYKLHPEFGSSFHGKISNIYHRMIFKRAAKGKEPILTISYFTKYQLIDFYHISPERIHVIGCAWQHFNRISRNDTVLSKYKLNSQDYFFSLGSVSKMKNTKWILEIAKNNPNSKFVISGGKPFSDKEKFSIPNNVIMTGYIEDEEIKSLICNCKAFIYPSLYDGFGIPPIEALSQNVRVICSSAACLPEVYGSTVNYIDPYDTKINLDEILSQKVSDPSFTLDKYSWEKSAIKLKEIIEKYKVE